jgi:K+-sensing histidine kinase KdpD
VLTITVVKGRQPGRSVECGEGVISLGRARANSIRIDDESVSSRHGQIAVQEGQCTYRDLGSKNGSVVRRGARKWQLGSDLPELTLEDGDRIVLGRTVLEVAIGPSAALLATADLGRLEDTDAKLRRDRDTLQAIYEMEREIHMELDPAKLGQRVLQAVLGAFPAAEWAAIASVEPGSLEVTGVTSVAAPGHRTARISHSMARKALEERRAICFEDAQTALAHADSVVAGGLQCAMCAPLWTGTDMRGVLQVATVAAPRCFSEKDLDLFTVFANRAAIALANAELHEERLRTAHFRELSDYLANELRNAATGLVAWLKPLEDGDFGQLEDLQLEAVRTGRIGAQMVSTMVTSMTDLAQLRQPDLVLEAQPVALHEAAEIPVKLASAGAQTEGIQVKCDPSHEIPPVMADPQLLQRVILNLLFFGLVWGRASGQVILACGMEEGVPVVRLEWEGDPIPVEHRDDIFDPATQARLWKDLGHRSVGIGLAFCKLAVQRMGGRIWVDASEGRNSVRLSLPVASAGE